MYKISKAKREGVAAFVTVTETDTGAAKIEIVFPDPAEVAPNRAEIRRMVALGAGIDRIESVILAAAAAEGFDLGDYEKAVGRAEVSAKAIKGIDKRLGVLSRFMRDGEAPDDEPETTVRLSETVNGIVCRYYARDLIPEGTDPFTWFVDVYSADVGIPRLIEWERKRMLHSKARSVLKQRTLDRLGAMGVLADAVTGHLRALIESPAFQRLSPKVRAKIKDRFAAVCAAKGETAIALTDAELEAKIED